LRAYELKHRMNTDMLFCDKTQVLMFYFDSKTARPIVPLYALH